MKRPAILLIVLVQLSQAAGQLPDANQIMDKIRDLTLARSLRATISLTITERNGSVRSRTIAMTTKSYADGQEKRFIRFMEPADVRGTSMLVIDNRDTPDEMWIYLPAFRKTRRIVTAEKGKSFMSSEFTNADMSSPATSDFINRHAGQSGRDNQWVIESIPVNNEKAGEYGFSRKVSYITTGETRIMKMEFYNSTNELFKVIEIKSIHPLPDGKYMIENMTADNLINKRKSEILFTSINSGVAIEDSFFSLQSLER